MPQSTVKQLNNQYYSIYIYENENIQIFKMDHFRIQLVKQPPPFIPTQPIKTAPKLHVGVTSITCLNYPIETLSQVIAAHFDQQPCTSNHVLKALKIISISLKDKELRQNFQRILMTNLCKREKIYNLFVLWTSTTSNLVPTISKLNLKLVQNLLGVIFAHYCFTNCIFNSHISNLINTSAMQLPPESVNKVNQYMKNQFMTMSYPIDVFLSSPKKLKGNKFNQNFSQFLTLLSNSICKSQRTQNKFRTILNSYFVDEQVKDTIDQFISFFPHLIQYFIHNLSFCLNKAQILQIWSNCSNKKMEQAIRTAVKQWIANKKNLWEAIDHNFNKYRNLNEVLKFQALLQLGSEIVNNMLSNFIIKKSLYNFFTGIFYQPEQDFRLINLMNQSKQTHKIIHSSLQTFSEIIKCSKNTFGSENINFIVINKIMAPQNWNIYNFNDLSNFKSIKVMSWIQKVKQLSSVLYGKMNDKGKKVELAFHVIKIEYSDETENKKTYFLSGKQIQMLLKTGKILQESYILDYQPFENEQKKIEKKQIQGIVIEAKIVRILKKSRRKLNLSEIFDQVVKQLDVPEENCRIALQRVVSKGFAESEENGMYIYCP